MYVYVYHYSLLHHFYFKKTRVFFTANLKTNLLTFLIMKSTPKLQL